MLIVGAGQIGCFYDKPKSKNVLTHAHAVTKNTRLALAGICDIDSLRAKKAAKIWKTNFFSSIEQAFKKAKPDIVVISCSTENHLSLFRDALVYRPKFIVLEKPLAYRETEAAEIYHLARNARVPVLVNYLRRFDSTVRKLKASIAKYGAFLGGSGFYCKGIKNNGSHMLDLLQYLVGSPTQIQVTEAISDTHSQDLTVGGSLSFSGAPFHLVPIHKDQLQVFELTLLFEKARVHFKDYGENFLIETVQKRPKTGFGPEIKPSFKILKTKLSFSFQEVTNSIIQYLDYGKSFESTIDTAYQTEKLVHEIFKRAQQTRQKKAAVEGQNLKAHDRLL